MAKTQNQTQNDGKIVPNREIVQVLRAFRDAVMCVPRGICVPDAAQVAVSKYFVSFVHGDGEVKAARNGVEVRAGGYALFVDSYGMFVLLRRNGDGTVKRLAYGPRLVLDNEIYTADEFIDYVRKGIKALLSAAIWL